MLPQAYNNNVQLFQTPEYLVILKTIGNIRAVSRLA
jgi:hypothetical protein